MIYLRVLRSRALKNELKEGPIKRKMERDLEKIRGKIKVLKKETKDLKSGIDILKFKYQQSQNFHKRKKRRLRASIPSNDDITLRCFIVQKLKTRIIQLLLKTMDRSDVILKGSKNENIEIEIELFENRVIKKLKNKSSLELLNLLDCTIKNLFSFQASFQEDMNEMTKEKRKKNVKELKSLLVLMKDIESTTEKEKEINFMANHQKKVEINLMHKIREDKSILIRRLQKENDLILLSIQRTNQIINGLHNALNNIESELRNKEIQRNCAKRLEKKLSDILIKQRYKDNKVKSDCYRLVYNYENKLNSYLELKQNIDEMKVMNKIIKDRIIKNQIFSNKEEYLRLKKKEDQLLKILEENEINNRYLIEENANLKTVILKLYNLNKSKRRMSFIEENKKEIIQRRHSIATPYFSRAQSSQKRRKSVKKKKKSKTNKGKRRKTITGNPDQFFSFLTSMQKLN